MSISLKSANPQKILVRSTNWIGDAIMTTPAIRTIRQNFPKAEISVLVHPWVADVFSASPHIDRVINYYKKTSHRGLPGMRRLALELRAEHFDLAILLQNAFEAALLTYMAGIPLRAGYSRDCRGLLLTHAASLPRQRRTIHQVHYYQELLVDLGLTAGPDELFLTVHNQARERAAKLLNGASGPIVGLNPGASYGPAKRWPVEKYAQLAGQLVNKLDARIIVFGTEADQQAAGVIKHGCGHVIDLTGKTSLAEAMALIDLCAVFVTNDSGLMHVAAALQTPLVAVFGSTNPLTTGPYSDNAVVIRHPMPCSPCMKTDCRGDFACMENIGPDEVGAAVTKLLVSQG
ncbi:MAG: lipopolysaccharide heptosyltransferase II [Deltaproteobacteria bacterium]|nr:lipopolysaccharide heptosyltransferase II [Deltaproteobacteria bacterium]